MKKDYTLRILLTIGIAMLLKITLFASGKGYLITKDAKKITGQVVSVNFTPKGSEMIFVNDFGDLYCIHPFLISGFVYQEDGTFVEYQSKFDGRNWVFLKVEVGGSGIKMYKNFRVVKKINQGDLVFETKSTSSEYWIEKKGEKPFRVYLLGFRSTMRKAISNYPELAAKIGDKGYRYKNLRKILEEYNEWYEDMKIRL